MAAGPYVESRGLVDHRPAVVPVGRLLRESLEHVEARDYAAVLLNVAYGFLYVLYQLRVQAAFGLVDGGFGAEYLLLVFLEFGGYVALGVHEGLLAYPFGRDPVAGAVADFDVVAEDVVVAYLERADSGPLDLSLLHLEQVFLASAGNLPEPVELGVHACGYHVALSYLAGRVFVEGLRDAAEDFAGVAHAGGQLVQGFDPASGAEFPDGLHAAEGASELQHLAGEYLSGGHSGDGALEVAGAAYLKLNFGQYVGLVQEMLHYVVAGVELAYVHYRHRKPLAQQTRAHGRAAAVDGVHERDSVPSGRALEDFQIADGELVHPDELLLVDAGDRTDVPESCVLGLFEIGEQGAGRADGEREALHGVALEAPDLKLRAEFLHGGVVDEGPFVEAGDVVVAESLPDRPGHVFLDHELFRLQGGKQGGDVVGASLGDLEGSGGHVEEGCPALVTLEAQPRQVVVLLLLEHGFAEGYSGSQDFRDPALHQLGLREGRVFELVADGHLVAGLHELVEVAVDGMVGESGHLDLPLVAVGAPGEHEAEHLAGQHCVVGVGLVEIAHPVEQHRLGMLGLDAEILFQQRRVFCLFRHGPAKLQFCSTLRK